MQGLRLRCGPICASSLSEATSPRCPLCQALRQRATSRAQGDVHGARVAAEGGRRFSKGAYTLGKVVPGKGWEELLAMLDFHQRALQSTATRDSVAHPSIDAYGSGEAFETVPSPVPKAPMPV